MDDEDKVLLLYIIIAIITIVILYIITKYIRQCLTCKVPARKKRSSPREGFTQAELSPTSYIYTRHDELIETLPVENLRKYLQQSQSQLKSYRHRINKLSNDRARMLCEKAKLIIQMNNQFIEENSTIDVTSIMPDIEPEEDGVVSKISSEMLENDAEEYLTNNYHQKLHRDISLINEQLCILQDILTQINASYSVYDVSMINKFLVSMSKFTGTNPVNIHEDDRTNLSHESRLHSRSVCLDDIDPTVLNHNDPDKAFQRILNKPTVRPMKNYLDFKNKLMEPSSYDRTTVIDKGDEYTSLVRASANKMEAPHLVGSTYMMTNQEDPIGCINSVDVYCS